MRSRNIKPGFFKNEVLGALPMAARLLFSGLWCLADRDGRLEDRPQRIKMQVLPYDACDVEALLQTLHEAGFIRRYQVEGIGYIQVVNFARHQRPRPTECQSMVPPPLEETASQDSPMH